MIDNSYDKIKLIILRAALILMGASIGFLALWQYFAVYPKVVKREYQIVITVVSSALIALIFGLSAKAVYRLMRSVAFASHSLKDRVGTRGIVAVALGLFVAVVPVVVFDIVIRRFVAIWAVRLLTDVLVYILCAAGCCVGFTKWFNITHEKKTDNVKAEKNTERVLHPVGYLLGADCFADERVLTAVYTLINVKVTEGAYKALCLYGGQSGADAARLMDSLIKSGKISAIAAKPFDGEDGYAQMEKQLAAAKRLKRISLSPSDGELSLFAFAPPTADIKNALFPQQKEEPVLRSET